MDELSGYRNVLMLRKATAPVRVTNVYWASSDPQALTLTPLSWHIYLAEPHWIGWFLQNMG